MQLFFIYPIYTIVLAAIVRLLIPLSEIKRLFIFGIAYGALVDGIIILIYKVLGLVEYINYGPFGFLGIPFFPLIAWTCYFLLYFYFLPVGKLWIYLYVAVASLYSFLFSNILQNLNILHWNHGRILIPIMTYFLWNCFATLSFLKLSERRYPHP